MRKKKNKLKRVKQALVILCVVGMIYMLFIWDAPDEMFPMVPVDNSQSVHPRSYMNMECSNNWYEDNYCWNSTHYCEAVRIDWNEPYVLGKCDEK